MRKATILLLLTLLLFLPSQGEETTKVPKAMQPSQQELTQRFVQLVHDGELEKLLERTTFNLRTPTFGGHIFWETTQAGKWRLQINSVFGNWRILDDDGIRHAWGTTLEQLADFLHNRPLSILANYLDDGEAFSHTPSPAPSGKTLFLIHGWGVRAHSMDRLAEMLHRNGYSVLNYDYPSSKKRIEQHAEIFLELYRREHLQGKIHFLTHSMGGLILRYALAEMTEDECRAIDSIVMLGPPNRGSLLALFGELGFVKDFNLSLADMVSGNEALLIPPPPYLPPVGIIAGLRDGKVPLESTALPDGLPFRRTTVNCSHPELRDPLRTGMLIRHFFQFKTFNEKVR